MPDAAWKQHERDVAKALGGKRRGPDVGGVGGGNNDVIVDGLSVECKLLGRPSWSHCLAAVAQAQAAASDAEVPIAVMRKKGQSKSKALVLMSLNDFVEWFA